MRCTQSAKNPGQVNITSSMLLAAGSLRRQQWASLQRRIRISGNRSKKRYTTSSANDGFVSLPILLSSVIAHVFSRLRKTVISTVSQTGNSRETSVRIASSSWHLSAGMRIGKGSNLSISLKVSDVIKKILKNEQKLVIACVKSA